MPTEQIDWRLCPRCKKREREVSTVTGYMEIYCSACNDVLAASCREANERLTNHELYQKAFPHGVDASGSSK